MPNPIHDPSYALFREMLTNARLANGILQSTVAEKLGKNQSFVSKYERGERRLDLPEFLDIAEVLKIDVVDFIKQYKEELKNLRRKNIQIKK
jgi:transcriptional regulator with XRE-family HTH domain